MFLVWLFFKAIVLIWNLPWLILHEIIPDSNLLWQPTEKRSETQLVWQLYVLCKMLLKVNAIKFFPNLNAFK